MGERAVIVSSHLIQARVLEMILIKLGYRVDIREDVSVPASDAAELLFTDPLPISKEETVKLLVRLRAPKVDPKPVSPEVFSTTALDENFMGNLDLVKSLLARFVERTARQIAAIPGMAESGDWETAHRDAHTIKGSARSMSGMELGDAAMRWEETCKRQDLDAVKALAPEVEEAFARFKTAVEQFISSKGEGE
ncbi:MAG: Hpt domain-containing protein [Treponema sp.]|nr:Hpt domain-containing protein [Treponema sp.]